MHPVQALLIRHSITALFCSTYMWWSKTPDFPFGKKEIRWLLWLRGASGFWGIFGVWYSMMYISLADATVITFLAPGVAGIICWFALREPFTRIEQLATLVAFLGVVLIARPASLFSHSGDDDDHSSTTDPPESAGMPGADHEATPEERLIAVGVALLGVFWRSGCIYNSSNYRKTSPSSNLGQLFRHHFHLYCTLYAHLCAHTQYPTTSPTMGYPNNIQAMDTPSPTGCIGLHHAIPSYIRSWSRQIEPC